MNSKNRLPNRGAAKHSQLGKMLDIIHQEVDRAIYRGYAGRKGAIVAKSLRAIIEAAEEAESLIAVETLESPKHNVKVN